MKSAQATATAVVESATATNRANAMRQPVPKKCAGRNIAIVNAEDHRNDHIGDSDLDGIAAVTPGTYKIYLKAGLKQQKQHAQPGHRLKHILLDRIAGKDHRLKAGAAAVQAPPAQAQSPQAIRP